MSILTKSLTSLHFDRISPYSETTINLGQVRRHAAKLLNFLSHGSVYGGEVFLCGGAFKSIINPKLQICDLDLWVRDRKAREHLTRDLLNRGAKLITDFHPYCMLFDLDGAAIEITYHNVKQRHISEIVQGFDLAGCAIAAHYTNGKITDAFISRGAANSIETQTTRLEGGYLQRLRSERLPTILRSIDRLGRFATDLHFDLHQPDIDALWDIYFKDYDADERQRCIDIYLETTSDYKGRCDLELLKTAYAVV
jgi:hypothetical protein